MTADGAMLRETAAGAALSYGPVRMDIRAWRGGAAQPALCRRCCEEAALEFDRLAPYMGRLREMRAFAAPDPAYPSVLNKMIAAVSAADAGGLNTLAAVAGAFSEFALERAAAGGADRVVVDNGGDLAILAGDGWPVRVSIPLAGGAEGFLAVGAGAGADGIRGVCTSGFGGRSFTKGVADAVTVFARSASLADACATAVANEVTVDGPTVLRCRAEEIDSGTDIPGQLVTLRVGALSRAQRLRAAARGAGAAQALLGRGVILGALIRVGDVVVRVPDGLPVFVGGQGKGGLRCATC
ncbi:MAG: UPF0280 family protein [Clostridiales Family XIII bacterium]|jgi:ApbE superfamily uncharacterized protein (UPF0280 family)|nr:UPF0280 family protein [Clostridiales Family XIII bacterium]